MRCVVRGGRRSGASGLDSQDAKVFPEWATKYARSMVFPPQIQVRLDALGVLPGDVEERFVRGSGPGGQKINKTSSTVCLRHAPTGVEVRCQRERSQVANREAAWGELCERLEGRLRELELARRQAVERRRRQSRGRSRTQKARMVADKRARAQVRALRGRVRGE